MPAGPTTRLEITTETAFHLRHVRGLKLPTDRQYADPCVERLAQIQGHLWDLMKKTDKELLNIFTARH